MKLIVDFLITIFLWIYFFMGGFLLYFPAAFITLLLFRDLERAIQFSNHLFFRIFFLLLRTCVPGVSIEIDPAVAGCASSIVVSNHVSYLDPILLVSLFRRQKTIVKGTFFRVPVFGWALRAAGYLPYFADHSYGDSYVRSVQGLDRHLAAGGILFVFPEGTRRTDGGTGSFKKGAFAIAQRCEAPVDLLLIRNTNLLFRPGRFLFNTCVPVRIRVEYLGRITPAYDDPDFSLKGLVREIKSRYPG